MAREIPQATFDEAARLMDLIGDLRNQMAASDATLAGKLLMRKRIDQLIAARRELLCLDA